MEFGESWKFFAFAVAAGVVTALAIQVVNGYLQTVATQTAKAELQKLMLAAASQQNVTEQPVSPPAPTGTATML